MKKIEESVAAGRLQGEAWRCVDPAKAELRLGARTRQSPARSPQLYTAARGQRSQAPPGLAGVRSQNTCTCTLKLTPSKTLLGV